MTDISNWRETIHYMQIRHKNLFTGELTEDYNTRLMIPINSYLMGNLIDAISQAHVNGDWYGEFCDIVGAAMEFANIKEIRSNRGKIYTLEEVQNRNIRKEEK